MISIDDLTKNVSSYLKKNGVDPQGIDNWKSRFRVGMNHKIVGFLYMNKKVVEKKDFVRSFSEQSLSNLYNDLRERETKKKKSEVEELDSVTKTQLLETLYRYSVTMGLIIG